MMRMRITLILTTLGIAASLCRADDPYTRIGFPPHDRPWQATDYQKAGQLLSSGAIKLWRVDDPLGARYLARLTALENLAIYSDQSIPIEQRLEQLDVTVMKAIGRITGQYVKAAQTQPAGSRSYREMIQLHAFTLRIMERCIVLIEEMLPAIRRDDKGALHIAQLQASVMKTGEMFGESIGLASETKIMPAQDISFLLRAMQATLPTLKRGFTAEFKIEAKKSMENNKLLYWSPADLAAVDAMIAEIDR